MLDNEYEDRGCGSGNNGCCNNSCNNNLKNMNCEYTPEGINAAFGYNTINELDNTNCNCSCNKAKCCEEKAMLRNEMLEQIKCLNFAIIDLSEYLNTHPDDRKALCLHKEYCRQLKELEDKYQRVYGPLSIYYPCNKWRWLEEPWPWEGGNC